MCNVIDSSYNITMHDSLATFVSNKLYFNINDANKIIISTEEEIVQC